jgi:hypothetical protein
MSQFDRPLFDESLFDETPALTEGAPVFLGLIVAAALALGLADGNLPLGVAAPQPASTPLLLGKADGAFPLGGLNAAGLDLGVIAAPPAVSPGRPLVFLGAADGNAISGGFIDAAPGFLGLADARLRLGIAYPVPTKPPRFLGLADAAFPLGLLNAAAPSLGTVEAGAQRLGEIPVRTGF